MYTQKLWAEKKNLLAANFFYLPLIIAEASIKQASQIFDTWLSFVVVSHHNPENENALVGNKIWNNILRLLATKPKLRNSQEHFECDILNNLICLLAGFIHILRKNRYFQ